MGYYREKIKLNHISYSGFCILISFLIQSFFENSILSIKNSIVLLFIFSVMNSDRSSEAEIKSI